MIRTHDDIAVIIADQRMPDMTGVDLLRETLQLLPHAIRIILTGYTDVDVLMEAINSCKVYPLHRETLGPTRSADHGRSRHRGVSSGDRERQIPQGIDPPRTAGA